MRCVTAYSSSFPVPKLSWSISSYIVAIHSQSISCRQMDRQTDRWNFDGIYALQHYMLSHVKN